MCIRDRAYLFRGVRIKWSCDPSLLKSDSETPATAELHFPGGLRDSLAADLGTTPQILPEIWAGEAKFPVGPDGSDQGKLEWACAWIERGDSSLDTYCNTVPTPLGGTHEAGFRAALLKGLRAWAEPVSYTHLTANFLYFDNAETEIGPEHIMASGALPPALPMVRIGKQYYWDGGLVSNTPLQHLLDHCGNQNMLVFQVDLFSANGDIPRDMPEVLSRQKDIQYSSRTRTTTDHFLQTHKLKQALRDALNLLPYERLTDAQTALKLELERLPEINIMQLIYQQKAYEGDAKDYEFSRLSMKDHWRSGYYDTRNTLAHSEWLEMKGTGGGIHSHDIHSTGE